MWKWRRSLIAVCLTISALAVPAVAQNASQRDRDPSIAAQHALFSELQNATFHHGSLYLRSRLELSDIGANEDFSAPTSDQTTGLTFGIQAPQQLYYVPVKKFVLSAKITPTYSFFQRNGLHGQGGYEARGDAHFLLNHLYMDVYYSKADQLHANIGELDSVYTARQSITGVNSEFKYSSRTSVTFAGSYNSTSYPTSRVQPLDQPITLLDSDTRSGRVALRHKTFPLTSLSAIVDVRHYNFGNAREKNSKREFAGIGVAYDNGRNSLSMEAGLGRLTFVTPGLKGFNGPLGSATLSRRVHPRWSLTASALRDTAFSIYGSNNYYVSDLASVGVQYSATRRLTLSARTDVGRDSYSVPFEGVIREDQFSYTSVGWLYNLRRIHGGFDVGYYRRTSNAPSTTPRNGIRTVLHLSLTP